MDRNQDKIDFLMDQKNRNGMQQTKNVLRYVMCGTIISFYLETWTTKKT